MTAHERDGTQPATIYDVAALAGVNPSTVSRALSKPGRISPATEKRIQDAARTLDYHVNPMARALPTGRTHTLGLIVTDITNPVYFTLLRGAERAAARAGYTLVLAESQESEEREAEATERVAPAVDGLILVATRQSDEQLRALATRKRLIVVNRDVTGVESMVPNLEPGIDQALAHLAELGHRSVAYLAGPANSWMSTARWAILQQKACSFGMSIVSIGTVSPTVDGGREAYPHVGQSAATAVLAYNDLIAIGLLRAAQEGGIIVPAQLSIIGFDDIFGSDFTSPPLTTIRSPLSLIGELAVRRVLELVAPQQPTDDGSVLLAATELVVRGSTGSAPR